jgi:hypothetical protein
MTVTYEVTFELADDLTPEQQAANCEEVLLLLDEGYHSGALVDLPVWPGSNKYGPFLNRLRRL